MKILPPGAGRTGHARADNGDRTDIAVGGDLPDEPCFTRSPARRWRPRRWLSSTIKEMFASLEPCEIIITLTSCSARAVKIAFATPGLPIIWAPLMLIERDLVDDR